MEVGVRRETAGELYAMSPVIVMREIRSPQRQTLMARFEEGRREVDRAMDVEVKPHVLGYFERITANWQNKPEFKARKEITPDRIAIRVWPSGAAAKVWEYVSKGSRPHEIRPKKAGGKLRFMGGTYQAKTGPGGHYKGPGKVVGGQIMYAKRVMHPGVKAREFEKHIHRWATPGARKMIENAMRRGMRRAG